MYCGEKRTVSQQKQTQAIAAPARWKCSDNRSDSLYKVYFVRFCYVLRPFCEFVTKNLHGPSGVKFRSGATVSWGARAFFPATVHVPLLSSAQLTACQAASQPLILWDTGEDGQPRGKTDIERERERGRMPG